MADSKAKLVLLVTVGILLFSTAGWADNAPLSTDDQRAIIANYMIATGQRGSGISASVEGNDSIPIKCGMSAVADFVLNRDRIDPRLMTAMGAKLVERPSLDLSFVSPSGHFKIHYTKTGADSVYRASVDANANNVPDFVENVATICDSVWIHHIIDLGYPAPPSDSFYAAGDGKEFDVYLHDLGPDYFGLSYLDSTQIDGAGTIRATSFMELDNDYQQIVAYKDRPLDAVRVTVAHEFFHSIQFGIDFSEAEVSGSGPGSIRRYWMEMSAVWMEEATYTAINDYYAYLPAYFNFPMVSLQRFRVLSDNHPYGAVVYPLYLSQKFGPKIIKDIWLKCGQLGAGPSFLVAADQVIDSASNHTLNWARAFREFALWNYFTGSGASGRANLAPAGVGYTERANYPIIPDSVSIFQGGSIVTIPEIDIVTKYPHPDSVLQYNQFPLRPEHNGASLIRLENIGLLAHRYWAKGASVDPESICVLKYVDTLATFADSTELSLGFIRAHCPEADTTCSLQSGCTDTTLVRVDSTVAILAYTGPDLNGQNWGLNVIYRYTGESATGSSGDSLTIDTFMFPSPQFAYIYVKNPERFKSMTLIFTPATSDLSLYTPDAKKSVGYFVDETFGLDSSLANRAAAVLTPYPNPAVVPSMGGKNLMFRFQMPTDAQGLPDIAQSPSISVDLYNVAGERVRTLKAISDAVVRVGTYETGWDMKNSSGADVTSGVYIAVARLYSNGTHTSLLAEQKVKVLIVR